MLTKHSMNIIYLQGIPMSYFLISYSELQQHGRCVNLRSLIKEDNGNENIFVAFRVMKVNKK